MRELKFKPGQIVYHTEDKEYGLVTKVDSSFGTTRVWAKGWFSDVKKVNTGFLETYFTSIEKLELYQKTLDTLSVGDVVVDDSGDEFPVLAVLGTVIGLGDYHGDGRFYNWYTLKELKDDDYTVKQPEEADDTVEVTLEEVAKLKNVPVEKLRIKKEAE